MRIHYSKTFGSIFFISIIAIAAYFWLNTTNESKQLRSLLMQSYELMLEEKNLQTQLSHSNMNSDTDNLNRHLKMLMIKTDSFARLIKNYPIKHPEDAKFIYQIEAISMAYEMRVQDIEDYKTLRSLITNSFMWLRTQEQQKSISSDEALIFNHIMDAFYATDLEEQIPTLPTYHNPLIQQHIRILYNTVSQLEQLNKKLAHTRTDSLLENLVLSLQIHLAHEEALRTLLMWSFITAILLSLLAGIILYFRERASFFKSESLRYDLNQFNDALNASNIISKTDFNGIITFVNDTFCSISGFTREELIGQSHSIVRHPDTPSSLFQEIWDTIRKGKVYKVVLKNKTKDGHDYYVNTTIIPIKNDQDKITEFLAIRHDVSELVQSRNKAIAADQFKDRFLSNMSHELRTPLNAIMGFSHLLEEKSTDNTQRKYAQYILESSNHLLEIINDILDLSKIQNGKLTVEVKPFNLYSSLISLIERMSVLAKAKHINFTYELEVSPDQEVQGDWLRISQVLTNILSNAFKFTANNGKVALKAIYTNGTLECKIADNGIGMDEVTIERIFQPFEQADISTTRQYGGTGLGLSITKELIQLMGGKIDVNSRVNNGTQFTVTIKIPSINVPIIKKDVIIDKDIPLHGHILIVEDDELNSMVITSMLDVLGLTYTIAIDGLEALKAFPKEHFDLILMDENMPNMRGIEAMKEIRKLPGGNLPIVALTANNMLGDREHFLNEGMDDFLPKPISVERLRTTLIRNLKS